MKLEDIKAMAETDLLIDKSNLTSASIDTPLMVNKYYNVLIEDTQITHKRQTLQDAKSDGI